MPSGFGMLRDDYKAGKVTKAELRDRLAKLHESSGERRQEHRKALRDHWGSTLSHPACREELRHHGRRSAFLNRALLLAQTDATVKDKEKLIERIEKLFEKEDERHARAMERLKSMPGPEPSASAAPAAPASAKRGDQ
jgi:hypothetical protein